MAQTQHIIQPLQLNRNNSTKSNESSLSKCNVGKKNPIFNIPRKNKKPHDTKNLVNNLKKLFKRVVKQLTNFPKELHQKLFKSTNIGIFKECLMNPQFHALMKKKADTSQLIRMLIKGRAQHKSIAHVYRYMNRVINGIYNPQLITEGFWTRIVQINKSFQNKQALQQQSVQIQQSFNFGFDQNEDPFFDVFIKQNQSCRQLNIFSCFGYDEDDKQDIVKTGGIDDIDYCMNDSILEYGGM